MSKKNALTRPLRDPDHHSKRGVPYWWAPEWIRATTSAGTSYQKLVAVKEKNGQVDLHIKSKSGSTNYIQGSIQEEFKAWHEDRSIDYILLGIDVDEIIADET